MVHDGRLPHGGALCRRDGSPVEIALGMVEPPALICLERIEELKGVADRGNEIFIGAAYPCRLVGPSSDTGQFPGAG